MRATPIVGQRVVDQKGELNITGASLLEQMVENLIVVAPNGTQYRIVVDNSGNLSTEAV